MRRREFIALLTNTAIARPLAVRAQQPMPVIGILSTGSPMETPTVRVLVALRQGLQDAGYVEGQNVVIEYRFAEGRYDRLPALAAELVRRPVAVIVTSGTPGAPAARTATATIPIVFIFAGDPVAAGLVASLNRPGGNATGVSFIIAELGAKKLELLRELVSTARPIAVLVNRGNPAGASELTDVESAAHTIGQQIEILNAGNDGDLEALSATLERQRPGALLIGSDPFLLNRREQLVSLAARHRLPALYPLREYVLVGGLISYGTSLADAFRQGGVYVGRILKGAKPAELPVVQPTKFELVINLKTAKQLGIDIPPALLARADEAIE
jgi:putative tryptophan/tyrosine transport system substrate-binding protein